VKVNPRKDMHGDIGSAGRGRARNAGTATRLRAAVLVAIVAALPCPAVAQVQPRVDGTDAASSAFRDLSNADALVRAGRLGPARAAYARLVEQFPTWWIPQVKLAVVSRELGAAAADWGPALARARRFAPAGDGYLEFVLALAAAEKGAVDDAASGIGPSDPVSDRALLARARGLETAGRASDAAREYRSLLARRPRCPAARWGLARCLKASGAGAEAAALLREGAAGSVFPARWRASAGEERRDSGRGGP
jgi:hypothetical protein